MRTYKVIYTEITNDRGYLVRSAARNNWSEYHTTSAYMHDAITNYRNKYNRLPTAAWYRKKCRWEKERIY